MQVGFMPIKISQRRFALLVQQSLLQPVYKILEEPEHLSACVRACSRQTVYIVYVQNYLFLLKVTLYPYPYFLLTPRRDLFTQPYLPPI